MISVDELFTRSGADQQGSVRWGEQIPLDAAGVYVVATTPDASTDEGLAECPLVHAAVATLLTVRPEATVDGVRADADSVSRRLREMWIPGSPIAYVGLASRSVRKRVRQFYTTATGARAPHAGGWPIKMLDADTLWVHYGAAANPTNAERSMLSAFAHAVPQDLRSELADPSVALPFAKLQLPGGVRKRHGLSGVKATARQSSTIRDC